MSNSIISTVPFSYDEIYTDIETQFSEAGYDIEPGSNTSQLIGAMSYLVSMLNANTAVNINETLLPLATKSDNARQDARVLGYEVAHKQSYEYRLTLTLNSGTGQPFNYIIPKYTEFSYGDYTYYYMGQRIELEDINDGYQIELNVREGILYKFEDNEDVLVTTTSTITDSNGNTVNQYYVDVPYVDVEANGLEVFLTYYDDSGTLYNREKWYQSNQFMVDVDTVLNKEFIRIDNIEYKTPRIYFKFSGVGTEIRLGTIIEINVLTTNGIDGAIDDITNYSGMTHNLQNAEVTNIVLLLEGTDEENISDIQANAPMFHNSANRAVTKQDYMAICNRHQTVDTSIVWGGDDEYPKAPGHIWFSFLPSNSTRQFSPSDEFNSSFILNDSENITNWYIENSEIRSVEYTTDGILISPGVWDNLDNYKIPTLEFHNRHPLYLDFDYTIDILNYDIKTSKADVYQEIFNIIDNAFTGNNDTIVLEDFESNYFHSSLEKRIDINITDSSGFNNSINTKLMLTSKNVSIENSNTTFRDIFIPLAIPFEDYFNSSGELLTDILPSINTEDFIGTDYLPNFNMNIYTDWSGISGDQSNETVIYVPIKALQTEQQTIGYSTYIVNLSSIEVWPDTPGGTDYSNVTILLNDVLVDSADYTITDESTITFLSSLSENDIVDITVNNPIGTYYLFNSYKKFILIQLFVNAEGYGPLTPGENNYSEAKSYLTTDDNFYEYTTDSFYLTTEGYAIVEEDNLSAITGPVLREITPELYTQSALKIEMFENVRYMNFQYASPNFKVIRNVIPRLHSVTFE